MSVTLSLVTCTYNSGKYLKDLLDSIQIQNNFDFEHIFIDANSTDDTLNLINQYISANIHKFRIQVFSQEPSGISAAMNFGLAQSSGNFIWYLHSDDRLHDKTSVHQVVTKLNNSKIDWLIGKCFIINEKNQITNEFVDPKLHFKNLKKYNCIPHASTIVSTSLLRKIGGFKKQLKFAMDYDLWLRLNVVTKPVFIEDYVADFREHNSSLSTSNPIPVHKEDFKVRWENSDFKMAKILYIFRFIILYIFLRFPKLRYIYLKIKIFWFRLMVKDLLTMLSKKL